MIQDMRDNKRFIRRKKTKSVSPGEVVARDDNAHMVFLTPWAFVCIDEAHYLRNPVSKTRTRLTQLFRGQEEGLIGPDGHPYTACR